MIYILSHNEYLKQGVQRLMAPLDVEALPPDSLDPVSLRSLCANDLLLIDSGTPSLLLQFYKSSFQKDGLNILVINSSRSSNVNYSNRFCSVLDSKLPLSEFHNFILRLNSLKKIRPASAVILSSKEIIVFSDSLNGMTIREISEKHGISNKSIYAHRRNACLKIGIRKVHDFIPFLLKSRLSAG